MRAYVRRGHVGFSFGCLGTAVIGVVIVLAAEAAAAIGLFLAAAGLVALLAWGAGRAVRAVREYRRTTLKLRPASRRRLGYCR